MRLYAAVGKALIEARTQAVDPFPEIEKLMTWEAFLASVEEAAKLAGPEDFDHLALVGNGYSYIRRYAPEFLAAFEFRAAPASEGLLKAIQVLRDLNAKLPEGHRAPSADPRRPEQGRGSERPGTGRVLQPPGRTPRPDV